MGWLTQVILSPVIVLTLLVAGIVVYHAANFCVRLHLQTNYENSFMNHVEDLLSREEELNNELPQAIPLTFQRREAVDLLALCIGYRSALTPSYYTNRANVRENPPREETNLLRLRRIMNPRNPEGLLRTQMIRCSENHALIASGDDRSGYILTRDDNEREVSGIPVFNIYAKFNYKLETVRAGERERTRESVELTPVVARAADYRPSATGRPGERERTGEGVELTPVVAQAANRNPPPSTN